MSAGPVTITGALGGIGSGLYNTYYIDLTNAAGGNLLPQEAVTTTLEFARSSTVRFTYTMQLYGEVCEAVSSTAPEITVTPQQVTAVEGETVVISVTGTDADGDKVTLGATPKITAATFSATSGSPASGSFSFMPSQTTKGSYVVAFTARDSDGNTATKTAEIVVRDNNHAPTLTTPLTQSVNEGGLLSFTIEGNDIDGDTVEYSADNVPENALFIPATHTFIFTPDFDQAGQYQVKFQATDGALLSGEKTVDINVNDVQIGGPGGKTDLVLDVNPLESPTLLANARVGGAVNSSGTPAISQSGVSALISGLSPSTVEQGAAATVTITGTDSGRFPTHFVAGDTSADFGQDVTVESVNVQAPTLALVTLKVAATAELGTRAITMVTGKEQAISLVAFNIVRGKAKITGTIVDPDTGEVIAGAIVTVQGLGIKVITGADGTFSLVDVPTGDLTLIVNAPNHSLFTIQTSAQAGTVTALGSIGSAATVFDPQSAPAVSVPSVFGRGAGLAISRLNKADLQKLILDTILVVGGDELGVVDAYGNQLNSEITGEGLLTLKDPAIELIANRMLQDKNYRLVDMFFSASFGFQWGGTGQALTLDEWLEMLQEGVNAAWADQANSENALLLVAFGNGATLSPEPPQISRSTTLNALQAFLLSTSLMAEMRYRRDAQHGAADYRWFENLGDYFIAPAYAQTAAGRFTGYWRNAFNTKAAFPMLIAAQANYVAAQSLLMMNVCLATPGGLGVVMTSMVAGQMSADFIAIEQALANYRLVPDAPTLALTDNSQGVLNFNAGHIDEKAKVITLAHFANANSKPTIVDQTRRWLSSTELNNGTKTSALLIDNQPPTKGVSFYAATSSYVRSNIDVLSDAYLGDAVITPWFGAAISSGASGGSTKQEFYTYWLNQQSLIYTSDFSAPVVFSAEFTPVANEIESIAVNASTGDVYASYPKTSIIQKSQFVENQLWAAFNWVNPGFANPYQKGVAVDAAGNIYSENSASDAQFGGRVFRYDALKQRTFVGSLNYFSQQLMFANPTMCGPIAVGPDQALYAIDAMSGDLRRIDVQATYDPYRRVGQNLYNCSGVEGSIVDFDFAQTTKSSQNGKLYLLSTSGVTGLDLGKYGETPTITDLISIDE